MNKIRPRRSGAVECFLRLGKRKRGRGTQVGGNGWGGMGWVVCFKQETLLFPRSLFDYLKHQVSGKGLFKAWSDISGKLPNFVGLFYSLDDWVHKQSKFRLIQ